MSRFSLFAALTFGILLAANASAGMPSVLPEDFVEVLRLRDPIRYRLQSISFFAAVFLVATVAFWGLWNYLARGFAIMPRLNLARAACLTLLISSLFVVVLTMISGARELLTPGAWEKDGVTYTLTPTSDASQSADETRP